MKELTKTVTTTEVTGYEAFDGTVFQSKEECRKYETSAATVAKQAAWHYLVADRGEYDLFRYDDVGLLIFDVPDIKAFGIIANWANLCGVWDANRFTPDYVGKRVGFYQTCGDFEFVPEFATKEAMLTYFTKHIEDLYRDADPKEVQA